MREPRVRTGCVHGRGRWSVSLLVTIVATMVSASSASAWTAANTGVGQVTIGDEVGATDAFTVTRVPGGFVVVNPASAFTGGVPADCAFDIDAQVLGCIEALALVVTAGGGDDVVTSEFPVQAFGGDGLDTLVGSASADHLDGGAGGDIIDGGEGADRLIGDSGNDQLSGGDGPDTLKGGDGEDTLLGGSGADTLAGGAGDDELAGGSEHDVADGGEGDDRVSGDAGDDTLGGGGGRDEIDGGAGADDLSGGPGADIVAGGTDDDDVDGDAGDDELSGDDGNDTLDGGDGADRLELGAGDDTALGGNGDDAIEAGAGADAANGGAGSDTITGSDLPGRATLVGGSGDDHVVSLRVPTSSREATGMTRSKPAQATTCSMAVRERICCIPARGLTWCPAAQTGISHPTKTSSERRWPCRLTASRTTAQAETPTSWAMSRRSWDPMAMTGSRQERPRRPSSVERVRTR